MRISRALLTASLGLFAAGSFGCNLQIDQIFAMQPGSGADVALVTENGEFPQGRLDFEGGAAMRITLQTDLLGYLDGTVDGDIELLDVLFGVPGFTFFMPTGLICVVLDDPAGGGTFSYDVLAQEATFDAQINTKALLTNQTFAKLIRGGAFLFPFQLESTIPLTLVDALGLFTGTGTLTVSQQLDEHFQAAIVVVKDDPSQDFVYNLHVTGEVTLQSTDTFPATDTVLDCVDFLGS